MSRLTEMNDALSRPAARAAWIPSLATPSGALGQCLQRTEPTRSGGGLAARLLRALRREVIRFRTVKALQELDAQVLADIGVVRGNIPELADEVARQAVAERSAASPARRFAPLAALRRAGERRAAIREFEALPDHILHDIGLERRQIEPTVDRLLARRDTETGRPARPAPRMAVVTAAPTSRIMPARHKAAA